MRATVQIQKVNITPETGALRTRLLGNIVAIIEKLESAIVSTPVSLKQTPDHALLKESWTRANELLYRVVMNENCRAEYDQLLRTLTSPRPSTEPTPN